MQARDIKSNPSKISTFFSSISEKESSQQQRNLSPFFMERLSIRRKIRVYRPVYFFVLLQNCVTMFQPTPHKLIFKYFITNRSQFLNSEGQNFEIKQCLNVGFLFIKKR